MKWLKQWYFLGLLVGMGIVYLTCVDKWQVYAEPLKEAMNRFEKKWDDGLLANGNTLEEAGQSSAPETTDKQEDGLQPEGGTENGEPENADTNPSMGVDGGPVSGSGNGVAPDGSQPGGNDPVQAPSEQPTALPEGDPATGQQPSQGEESTFSEGTEGPKEVTYMTVEDDYFADAVFIGDSRTMGLFEYGGLEETATFYASTGLTVYKMFESEIVPSEQGKISVEEALQQNSFAKIYFMIGINEMGTGTVESFLEAYGDAVKHLQELQPNAIIYLQAIIKVTTQRSEKGDYINNEGIIARNEGIAQMADNEHIFYLDVNPMICDETGGMIPEYTFDGVHLKAKYIDIWKDFLKTHAVSQ